MFDKLNRTLEEINTQNNHQREFRDTEANNLQNNRQTEFQPRRTTSIPTEGETTVTEPPLPFYK